MLPTFPWRVSRFWTHQADADVILRAELMGGRCSNGFSRMDVSENGGLPQIIQVLGPHLSVETHGFRDPPCSEPSHEWDDEFIGNGSRYMNVYDRFHRGSIVATAGANPKSARTLQL